MHSLPFAAPIALAALAATLVSGAGVPPKSHARHPSTARMTFGPVTPAALRFGRSLGSPTDGHLLGGMHLDETAYIRIVPADTAGDVRWGIEPLVALLDRAARSVRRQFPQAVTSVGHLSREGGGEIDQHRSHESGRDADVGFFVRAASGKQLLENHFVPFRADGTALSWPGAYFDDAKNWALAAAFLSDPEARVTHIFVAAPLRARLLAYAEKNGVSSALRLRAAEIMQQPHGTLPHDDHFHVRIGCPSHMSGCVENPAMRLHVSEPALARGRRGPTTHALVTPTPTRTPTPFASPTPALPAEPAPRATVAPSPVPAITPARKPNRVPGLAPLPDPSDGPIPPPASIAAPLDDVDG